MSIRCKFQLRSLEANGRGNAHFGTVYDPELSQDVSFALATPWGELDAHIDNPKALEQLEVGKNYYIDISSTD